MCLVSSIIASRIRAGLIRRSPSRSRSSPGQWSDRTRRCEVLACARGSNAATLKDRAYRAEQGLEAPWMY